MLLVTASLLGCAQEVPLNKRNQEFAIRDIELDRQKYTTFAGTKEREAVDQQIKDHNIDHSKFHLIDEINLGPTPAAPAVQNDGAARIKKINDLIDQQLHRTQ
ncbi:hypothetical protein GMLC_15950 [Geomonas limicola]|uniref:Uncharacterized protein n=1 Tax=Geomonas limicola TaxID=2740186 RepID=A0A6V8N632_9BACT|nr:hypothetical protein [Geomonas limicola]GFO68016.1 hypothetical protein GMLC_15950 [Geomonas limicola]